MMMDFLGLVYIIDQFFVSKVSDLLNCPNIPLTTFFNQGWHMIIELAPHVS